MFFYSAKDELNRLTSVENSEGRESSFEYDPLGRVTQRLYPDNTGADYTYDEAGRIESVMYPFGNGRVHRALRERVEAGLVVRNEVTIRGENGAAAYTGLKHRKERQ